MKITLCSLLMMAVLASCHKDVTPDCGCEGTPGQVLTDVTGVYKKAAGVFYNGYIVTLKSGNQYNISYGLSCNPEFINGRVSDGDTVVFNGGTVKDCNTAVLYTLIAIAPQLKLTAIRKR